MAIIKDGSRNVELTGKDKEEYIKHRFSEHYYNKRKPLMTVGCEEIVTSREQELEMRIEWLEKGLTEIYQDLISKPMKARNYKDAMRLLEMVHSIKDGRLITADNIEYWDLEPDLKGVPVITGDKDTDALLEDERINQEK